MSKGKQGGGTAGIERSLEKRRHMAAARKRQDRRWAGMAGPVVVTRIPGKDDGQAPEHG